MERIQVVKFFSQLFSEAEIEINGTHPWDMQLHDERALLSIFQQKSLGLGESYMRGWWDCEQLDDFIFKLLSRRMYMRVNYDISTLLQLIRLKFSNHQTPAQAFEVGVKHYDLGNDLFSRMLDPEMLYSCGYWKNAESLAAAQQAKMKLICDKLHLEPGMKLLDIGCGWGSLARYAAKNYGVEAVGVTVSEEQAAYAERTCSTLPVSIRLADYRDIKGAYDRIVSVGMFEHVGHKNYRQYMEVVARLLNPEGLFLLHTIGGTYKGDGMDLWMNKYIFPNGMLPCASQIADHAQNLFNMEDWHNIGLDYDRTLIAWYHNFEQHWNEIKHLYDETFFRMWKYYLLSCAAAFRARFLHVWQVVFTLSGSTQQYVSVR